MSAKLSFLDCPHRNVQQFTEICLDCGYNIYTSKAEYLADLQQKAEAQRRAREDAKTVEEIRNLERELNIGS